MSVGPIAIVGAMRMLCSAGGTTDAGLRLLEDLGLEIAPTFAAYRTTAEFEAQLRALAATGGSLVTQHRLPDGLLPVEAYRVAPSLLAYLNNKANLSALVPSPHVPVRRLKATAALAASMREPDTYPCVVKAAVDESTGGGFDVVLCRAHAEGKRACSFFAGAGSVIIEEYLDIRRNLCLNYAVLADGSVCMLGAADQIVDADGRFHGNWLDLDLACPAGAVPLGWHVAEEGARLGYRGCVGVDIALTSEGRLMAYDLNFRYNASTVPLLLFGAACTHLGCRVARTGNFTAGSFAELVKAVRMAHERRWLLPMAVFDPTAAGYPDGRPSVFALVLGQTRAEVDEHGAALALLGLT